MRNRKRVCNVFIFDKSKSVRDELKRGFQARFMRGIFCEVEIHSVASLSVLKTRIGRCIAFYLVISENLPEKEFGEVKEIIARNCREVTVNIIRVNVQQSEQVC